MEAHSELSSMAESDAFWTFNILPRIGRRAWYSEFRADLAVPRAESPSTIKSSVCSTSSERQSESFAGSDEDSSAFFRRWISLCARTETRVFAAPAIFSSTKRDCAFVPRELKYLVSSVLTTLCTIFVAAAVPRISLV